jgi:hypothetical protein
MNQTTITPMPAPPVEPIDQDRVAAAEERWAECPLRKCKRDTELLYEDFYLRDIRTNRIMCSGCAVRTEIGYIAQEVVKRSDDRFFQGTPKDYVITFFVTMLGSVIVNAIMYVVGFWFVAIFVGGAAGVAVARFARRLSEGRIGRQSANIAIGGIVVGMLFSPLIVMAFSGGGFELLLFLIQNPTIYLQSLFFNIGVLICTGLMAASAYGVFKRRI